MSDRNVSPLGDRRERAVPCRSCRASTWAYDGYCPSCYRQRSTTSERLAVKIAERLAAAPDHVVVRSLLDLDDLALARLLGHLDRAAAGIRT